MKPEREVMWEHAKTGMIIYTYETGQSRRKEMGEGPWLRRGFIDKASGEKDE